jgi:hypothetical protein
VFPATGAIFTQNEVNIGISRKISPFRDKSEKQNRWSTDVSILAVLRNRNLLTFPERPKVAETL